MPYESSQSLGYWCARITAALRVRLEARVHDDGLTCTSAIVLVALDKHGPTTLVELAHRLAHAHPTVLRQIDALEEAGYVERIPHEHDRRMKLVHLTDKGTQALPAIHRSMREVQGEAMDGFDSKDSAQLLSQLERVASNLGLADWSKRSTPKEPNMSKATRQQ